MDTDTDSSEVPTTSEDQIKPEVDESQDEEQEPHIPSIIDSISQEQIDNFQPFYKRYFEEKYCTKFTTPNRNLDTCVRVHSNKISVIYLSVKHSLFESGQRIKRLNFQISPKVNRLVNPMSGKGKRGAQLLKPDSILCYIETEDDRYPVHSGIYGKLLEINSQIVDNPNMVIDNYLCNGFIAIILPDMRRHEENMNSLKSKDDYDT